MGGVLGQKKVFKQKLGKVNKVLTLIIINVLILYHTI